MAKSFPPYPGDDPDVEPIEVGGGDIVDLGSSDDAFDIKGDIEFENLSDVSDSNDAERVTTEAMRRRDAYNEREMGRFAPKPKPQYRAPRVNEVSGPLEAMDMAGMGGNGGLGDERVVQLLDRIASTLDSMKGISEQANELLRTLGGLG